MKKKNYIEERKQDLIKTGLCETFDFIPQRFTKFENYTFDFATGETGKELLRMAIKELNLNDAQLERLERITKAILKFEGSTTAEACHIAEAVQYVHSPAEMPKI